MNIKTLKFTGPRIMNIISMLINIALCYFGLWYSQFLFIIFFFISGFIAINAFVIESRKKRDKNFHIIHFLSYQSDEHLPMVIDIVFYSLIFFMLGWTFTIPSLILFMLWWYSFYIDFSNRLEANRWWKRLPNNLKEKLVSGLVDKFIDNLK
jgi:c-di-AMP phosphodiesterase-like protein